MSLAKQLLDLLERYDLLDEAASVADIQKLAKNILSKHFSGDNLPIPRIAIKNNVNAGWLGMCRFMPSRPENTEIWIQKGITQSEKTLERVLTHELVHHWVFLTGQEVSKNGRYVAHDGAWARKAEEINQTMGANYVAEKSDEADEIEGKEFYVIIYVTKEHGLGWMATVSPSAMQKAKIGNIIATQQARIVRSNDSSLVGADKFSITRDPETNALLKDLYDNGKQVTIPGLDQAKALSAEINTKIDILGDGGRVLGTVSADYIRRKIRARSGTVDSWIAQYNDTYPTKARRAVT